MPRGDGTGPMGSGPMTGRKGGFCAGFAAPGTLNGFGGLGGRGCRNGAGRMLRGGTDFSYRNQFVGRANVDNGVPAVNEKELLTHQADILEQQLNQVKQRLEKIAADPE